MGHQIQALCWVLVQPWSQLLRKAVSSSTNIAARVSSDRGPFPDLKPGTELNSLSPKLWHSPTEGRGRDGPVRLVLAALCALPTIPPSALTSSPYFQCPTPRPPYTRPARADSGPASPCPQASGPLAGTVGGLLQGVGHPGGIGGAEELYGAPLQAHLACSTCRSGRRY